MIIERIRVAKEAQGMTNHDISSASGIPESTVTRILSGQTECPSFQNISAIARVLGVSLDDPEPLKPSSAPHPDTAYVAAQLQMLTDTIQNAVSVIRQKDRWLRCMFVYSVVLTVFILFLLLFDIISPEFGYIKGNP